MTEVTVTVNGTSRTAEIEPRTLLVHHLRDGLGLTGTHVGCETSNCGACTVHLDGEAVKSCTVLAVQADGSRVTTIEGLAPGPDGELHPMQQAFQACHGLQCGFCTPGMVMACVALLADDPDPDDSTIRQALEGNLCRCTGYQSIVESVRWAAEHSGAVRAGAGEGGGDVIPVGFDYVRPTDLDGVIAVLVEHGDDAKLLAGGHSLVPLMKLRLATPAVLVDMGRIDGLTDITEHDDHIAIGALTRHRALERSPLLARRLPLLAHAAGHVGDPQVRNRGTIGGSIAHGDGASDLPAVLLALRGSLVARGPGGERTIAADDFFRGFLETALAPDEVLTEIRVPATPLLGWSFQKLNRRAQDWAIVGCAVARTSERTGVGLVNMATTPIRAAATEARLEAGAGLTDAAAVADEGTSPSSDLHGSEEYRRHLARVLVGRALTVAA